jgi:exopolysaccharide biosynthesis polyprenyl glycosylphosphotransferase
MSSTTTAESRRAAATAAMHASQSAPPRQRQLALIVVLDALIAAALLSVLPASRPTRDGALVDAAELAAFAALAVMILAAIGGYGHPALRFGDKLGKLVRLVFASGLLLFALDLTHPGAQNGIWTPAIVFLLLPLAWTAARVVALRLAAPATDRTIIVGSSHVARHVLALANRHASGHVEVIGFVDDRPCALPGDAPPVLGSLADLPELCIRHQVQRVVVTFTTAPDAALLEMIRRCADLHLRIQVVPRLFDLLGPQTTGLGNLGLVDVTRRRPAGVELAAKRILDIVISALALTVLSPIILAIATCIKLDDEGPVMFRQERIGRRGRTFMICKFRSMSTESTPRETHSVRRLSSGTVEIQDAVRDIKNAGGDRVTRMGRFLRRTSLDELPQLWNVLRGEMSLVGPRPLRAFEVAALEPWQATRQDVLPGVTGLWQVLGRSDVDWHERQQLDFSYAHSWSLGTDLRILAETVPAVLRRRGAH